MRGWKKIAKPKKVDFSIIGSRIYKIRGDEYEVTLYRSLGSPKYYFVNVCGVTAGVRRKSRWIKSDEGISLEKAVKVFADITYSDIG